MQRSVLFLLPDGGRVSVPPERARRLADALWTLPGRSSDGLALAALIADQLHGGAAGIALDNRDLEAVERLRPDAGSLFENWTTPRASARLDEMAAAAHRAEAGDDARFRRIRLRNASIAAGARRPALGRDTPIPFLCECDAEECEAYVLLCLLDYDGYRDDELYLTAPGHGIREARRVGGRAGVDLYAAA